MEKNKKIIAVALLLVLVAAAALFWVLTKEEGNSERKSITVTVVHGDGSQRDFSLKTRAENLRQALDEAALVSGEEGPYGLYILTADGETADEAAQQWWCLSKNGGEPVMTGADDTLIADGECYELTLKTGW